MKLLPPIHLDAVANCSRLEWFFLRRGFVWFFVWFFLCRPGPSLDAFRYRIADAFFVSEDSEFMQNDRPIAPNFNDIGLVYITAAQREDIQAVV